MQSPTLKNYLQAMGNIDSQIIKKANEGKEESRKLMSKFYFIFKIVFSLSVCIITGLNFLCF